MSEHSILGPSGAHTWMTCIGAPAKAKNLPRTTSVYAEEGTEAHKWASNILEGVRFAVPEHEKEKVDFVAVYTNDVLRRAEGRTLLVETRVDIEAFTSEPGGKGTADAIIMDFETRSITVIDLKFGKGVKVYAERNKQGMLYALGALKFVEEFFFEVSDITIVINQPRLDHLDEWGVSRTDLLAFGEESLAKGKAALALMDQPMEVIDQNLTAEPDACRFCEVRKSKDGCPAIEKDVDGIISSAPAEFEDITGTLPTPDRIERVKLWLKAANDRVEAFIRGGGKDPNWKMIKGKRGDRKFDDPSPKGPVELLLKELKFKKSLTHTEPKLISPAQMEKVVGGNLWEKFTGLYSQSDGVPIVVPASHKGEPIEAVSTETEFEDLTSQEKTS